MKKWLVYIQFLSFLLNIVGKELYAQATSKQRILTNKTTEASRNRIVADSLFNLGSKYLDTQDYSQALKLLETSLDLYRRIGDGKKVGDCLNRIAAIYYYQGDYSTTIAYFKKSVDVLNKIGYKKGVATLLNNIGAVHDGRGEYLKALDYYRQAVSIFEKIGEKENLAATTQNIGSIYAKGKDYDNAMRYFNQAYGVYKNLNDQKSISQILSLIAEVYQNKGNYEEALNYLNQSMQIANKLNDRELKIQALFSLGELSYSQSDYKRALSYFNLCLAYSNEVGRVRYQSETQIAIGSIMHRLGKNKEAAEKCQYGLVLAEKLGSVAIKKRGCDCLYQSYKSLGNTQKALSYYEKANALDDSLNLAETSNKVMGMEFQKQQLVDSLDHVKKEAVIQLKHQQDVQQREKQRNIIIITLCFILLIAAGLWNRLNFTRKSRAALKIEKDRSEALLLNILPEEIAEELKEKGSVNARDYNLVSILFTDFKSFTQTAETMSPQSLVEEIDVCFRAFDLITEKYQVEKIKTIGDAYMAAGGIPHADESSLRNTVLAGLEMQKFMVERYLENQNVGRPAFEMRLGIHAGPIVAGIVGVKKFQYDVWGDTVNTASRMESNSEVGRVNISDALYEYIKHEDCFRFEFRGHLHAKGKGDMAMYFVEKSSVAQLVA